MGKWQQTTALGRLGLTLVMAALLLVVSACDTVEPDRPGRLVLQAFLDAGEPLPALTVRATRALDAPDAGGRLVDDAEVALVLDGQQVDYAAVEDEPGRYAPNVGADALPVPERSSFELAVRWGSEQARASGRIPPRVAIDSVRLHVPPRPVEAVLVDSLRLDTLATGARQGYVYPIDVDVYWTTRFAEVEADSSYWIRPYLRPSTTAESVVEDFFVRQDQVLRERSLVLGEGGVRHWRGVYAVPVATATDALPPHRLKVALLRSDEAYARFALTRDDPDRREPLSNVEGGLGIVSGVAIDSLQMAVR